MIDRVSCGCPAMVVCWLNSTPAERSVVDGTGDTTYRIPGRLAAYKLAHSVGLAVALGLTIALAVGVADAASAVEAGVEWNDAADAAAVDTAADAAAGERSGLEYPKSSAPLSGENRAYLPLPPVVTSSKIEAMMNA